MSEPKGPFDMVLEILKAQELKLRRSFFQTQTGGPRREQIRAAIRVLKDWPKWEPLIEAAGKVDKVELKDFIHLYLADLDPNPILEFMETVYMALPDGGKK